MYKCCIVQTAKMKVRAWKKKRKKKGGKKDRERETMRKKERKILHKYGYTTHFYNPPTLELCPCAFSCGCPDADPRRKQNRARGQKKRETEVEIEGGEREEDIVITCEWSRHTGGTVRSGPCTPSGDNEGAIETKEVRKSVHDDLVFLPYHREIIPEPHCDAFRVWSFFRRRRHQEVMLFVSLWMSLMYVPASLVQSAGHFDLDRHS